MFGKLFASMYEGSLRTRSPWQALVTFQQLIVLANKHGEVDMTAEALSFRTGIPFEIITTGIASLLEPDPDSRSKAEDGRRIVPLEDGRKWGWLIVNYEHYRKIRSEDERREYMRDLMQKKRASKRKQALADVSNVSQGSKQYAVSSMQEALSTSSSPREILLSAVSNRVAWEAVLKGALQGLDGPMLSPEQVERAVTDYVGNGEHAKPNLRHFRAYLRDAARPITTVGGARGGMGQRAFDTTMSALEDMP